MSITAPADPGIKRAKPAREKTMSKYRLENVVVDTDNASKSWDEMKYHDGNNWISKATGSQWVHQTLYRSRKGRFYIETTSQWQGSRDRAEFVSPEEAARWLLVNEREVPAELKVAEESVTE